MQALRAAVEMLAPAMVAVGLASFVVGGKSIYRSQLVSRADSPAHRFRFALPLLAAVPVGDAARQARAVVRDKETVSTARSRLIAASVPGAPVVDRDGTVTGLIDLASLEDLRGDAPVGRHLVADAPMLRADDGLDEALGTLADHGRDWAPVISGAGLAGILSIQDAMTAYRAALSGNVRQVRGPRAGGIIVEMEVGQQSVIAGRSVAEVPWPRNAVIVAVERRERLMVPRGDVVIASGDRISIFADPSARTELDTLLHTDREQVIRDGPGTSGGSGREAPAAEDQSDALLP